METTINLEQILRTGLNKRLNNVYEQIDRETRKHDFLERRKESSGLHEGHEAQLREAKANLMALYEDRRQLEILCGSHFTITTRNGYAAAHGS